MRENCEEKTCGSHLFLRKPFLLVKAVSDSRRHSKRFSLIVFYCVSLFNFCFMFDRLIEPPQINWSLLFYIYVLRNSFERLKELINFRQFFSLKHVLNLGPCTHELTLFKSKVLFITFCILLFTLVTKQNFASAENESQ